MLADVAAAAGVSLATASRALNGRARVDPAVRARVRAAAEKLGYEPNRAARSLVWGRSGVVGLVLPSERLTDDPHAALLLSSLAEEVRRREKSLLLWLTRKERPGVVLDALRSGLAEAVLVAGVAVGEPWVEELLTSPYPVVLLGRHPMLTDLPSVSVDDRAGGRAAVAHLLRAGRRRIALVGGTLGRLDAADRAAGCRAALAGSAGRLVATGVGDFTEDGGEAAMERLLQAAEPGAGPPFDGVFAASDLMARGAMRALGRHGWRVPEDVAVVGFDDLPLAATTVPPLTSVRQDLDAVALAALDLVDALLDRTTATPPAPVVLTPQLVVRASAP